jgi:hypothetical protein
MNDDIGARLGIIHRAGCVAPTTYAAMPFATMTGRNPYVAVVADGKGGELFRCTICGMVQGQKPEDEAPAPREAAPVPQRSADRVRLCREAVPRLRRDTGQVTISAISTATGFARETVAGYVGKGWLKLD